MRAILTYLATLVIFAAIDAVWLTLTGQRLYRATLGGVLLEGYRLGPAIAFYLVYVAGVVVFASRPATAWTGALWRGALFGAVAYATYDLTNYATLRAWTLELTVLDIAWGAFVTAAAATLGRLATGLPPRR